MAKIYLSYSHKDADFARLLTAKLRTGGHEVLVDTDALAPGQNWRAILSEALKDAEAFVALLSEASLSSQYTMVEIGSARAYSSQIGKPIVIPVLIDDVPIPLPLQDIQVIFSKDRNTDYILSELTRALTVSAAKEEANKEKAKEVAKKIEMSAAHYIRDAIEVQKKYEGTNKKLGERWNYIGFLALLVGILFSLVTLHYRPADGNWINLAAVVLTNLIVIGFLGACSRYAFSLGKSYVSESLKASDRIHAISFGHFYLNAFGERVEWAELKEAFQHWNIDRSSTFSGLDPAQIDPQILTLVGQMATVFGSKGKDKDK